MLQDSSCLDFIAYSTSSPSVRCLLSSSTPHRMLRSLVLCTIAKASKKNLVKHRLRPFFHIGPTATPSSMAALCFTYRPPTCSSSPLAHFLSSPSNSFMMKELGRCSRSCTCTTTNELMLSFPSKAFANPQPPLAQ